MSDLSSAIQQVCDEKNLDYDMVVSAIEMSLVAAYRKDFGEKNQNIKVEFDPKTGKSKIFDVKTVVEEVPEEVLEEMRQREEEAKERRERRAQGKPEEKNEEKLEEKKADEKDDEKSAEKKDDKAEGKEVKEGEVEAEEEPRRFNPRTEIQLSEAQILKSGAKVDDEIVTELPVPEEYGRMAAQTAKQVIVQKLREIERDMIYNEFKGKEGEVVSGVVQRREARFVLVDLGKAAGYLSYDEQIPHEQYNSGERIKVYIKEVKLGPKGAEIILSRKSEEILRKVFYLEIPEISNGLIEIKGVAREAGSRSKVAIYTEAENVDPVGSCVGQRGARIQIIISELGGEKVDIIEYDEDPKKFISNSLSPAQTLDVDLNEEEKKAVVKVAEDKLSLAIGKNGQNVRLAAHLTGWKIDIIAEGAEKSEEAVEASAVPEDVKKDKEELEEVVAEKEKNTEENKDETKEEEKKEKSVKEDKEKKKEKEEKKGKEDEEDKKTEEDKEEKDKKESKETKDKEENK
jgi:N utilization substance protein A